MIPQKTSAPAPTGPPLQSGEQGYLLLGVLVLVVLITLSLAVAAPVIATEVRRDKEAEFYHRGLQYARAVRLYYKQYGRYPQSIDQLQETNKIRYLRKRYVDPMTGKEFRLIHVGEARVQVPGFYGGDPIGPNSSAASTPIGGVPGTNPGTTRYGASGSSSGSSSNPFGSSGNSVGSSGNPFGSSGNSFGSSGNSFGSSGNSFGSSGSQTGTGSSGGLGSGTSGSSIFGSSTTGTSGSDSNSSGNATSGQTFGGLGIIGVSSLSDRDSIRVYRKQTKYNQWEFVYDAAQETLGASGIGPLQPPKPSGSVNTGSVSNGAGVAPTGVTQPATPPVDQGSPQD